MNKQINPFKESKSKKVRPTMYRAMKYWGKKPNDIWKNLIAEYSQEGSFILDPFAGSNVSLFEGIRMGRHVLSVDINPLTSFITDVYSSAKYIDINDLKQDALDIIEIVERSSLYKKNWVDKKSGEINNFIWIDGKILEGRVKDNHGNVIKVKPYYGNEQYNLGFIKEHDIFRKNISDFISISNSSLKKLGGKQLYNIWTERNFNLLVKIFTAIRDSDINDNNKRALIFGFLQSTHLTTKMNALRSDKSRRPFSSSWGRPAYLGLSKFMEQNPLIQFRRAIFGNAGLISALISVEQYIGNFTICHNIGKINTNVVLNEDFLSMDSEKLNNAFDLALVDPPYGSIIQYGELSLVWNSWLITCYPHYKIDLNKEIIINKSHSRLDYESSMITAFAKISKLLKNKGNMVLTFNSSNMDDWGSLVRCLYKSNFFFIDIFHNKNKRSSEATVGTKTDTGTSDFYLIFSNEKECSKDNIYSIEKLNKIIGDVIGSK